MMEDLPRPKQEPAAEMRSMAATMRQMRDALLDEGFTRAEVLEILSKLMAARDRRQVNSQLRAAVLARDRVCKARLERCTHTPTDVHHRVLKSQGGRLPDNVLGALIEGDLEFDLRVIAYRAVHLVSFCHSCHMRIHGEGITGDGRWMAKGSFRSNLSGMPVYYGADPQLQDAWPQP